MWNGKFKLQGKNPKISCETVIHDIKLYSQIFQIRGKATEADRKCLTSIDAE